jgi:hypothetical protein
MAIFSRKILSRLERHYRASDEAPMMRISNFLFAALLFISLAIFLSCSNQPTQQARQTAPSSPAPVAQPAAPGSQPAQSAPSSSPAQPSAAANISAGKPGGPLATEKHTLNLTNYSKVAVTATLNGVWIGQWDASSNVPLDTVLQGKNELKIDLAQQPGGEVTVEVNVHRNDQHVNLLRLNFEGKPAGSYTYYFAAR